MFEKKTGQLLGAHMVGAEVTELIQGFVVAMNLETTEDEYLAILRDLFAAIYQSPELSGFCYTQLTDTQQEKNGLYDENRQPKLPVAALRDIIWQPSNAVPTEYLDIARRKAMDLAKGGS